MTILQIAILGAGIFVKTQYYPRLSEISDIVSVKFIWSRSEEFAKSAVEIARKHFGGLEAVWGNQGLDRGINGGSCLGVAVVRARQFQLHGCEVVSVSATTSQVDETLPPHDSISCNFQLENDALLFSKWLSPVDLQRCSGQLLA